MPLRMVERTTDKSIALASSASSLFSLSSLNRDSRGATMTEYVILVGVVGLVVAVALVGRGKSLLDDYTNARDLVLLPAQ